ncbi:MAG TPA: hypothetical protein PK948_04985 [Gemmatimonadales bacterium]|nr:hypothetical protein [Gemmatimonadales bacterium]
MRHELRVPVAVTLAILVVGLALLWVGQRPKDARAQSYFPGQWSVTHSPAAQTAASASRDAGVGLTHVATSATCCVGGSGAQADIRCDLRDGWGITNTIDGGVGTILWSGKMASAANLEFCVTSPPLNLPGSVNVPMTLETSATPAANSAASLTLTGYSR